MIFAPKHNGPPTKPRQIRIGIKDWEKMEQIAQEVNEPPSEIARQAIRYALENLKRTD